MFGAIWILLTFQLIRKYDLFYLSFLAPWKDVIIFKHNNQQLMISFKICKFDIVPEINMPISLLDWIDTWNPRGELNLDYEVSVSLKGTKSKKKLELKILLQRKFSRSFIELISLPGSLVIVSWVGIT